MNANMNYSPVSLKVFAAARHVAKKASSRAGEIIGLTGLAVMCQQCKRAGITQTGARLLDRTDPGGECGSADGGDSSWLSVDSGVAADELEQHAA